MNKTRRVIAILSFGAVLLTTLPATAGNYRDSDSNIIITDLAPQQEVLLTYPGSPRTASARANGCGAVVVRGAGGVPITGTIKVDSMAIDTDMLTQKLLPACVNGSFQEARPDNFKTYDGSIVIVGKNPNQFAAIETTETAERRVRANTCGFALVRPNNRFTHAANTQVGINGAAPTTFSSLNQKGTLLCRNGATYYPSDWLMMAPGS
ncbi:hypothetical protein BST81_02250 [Leptolyngbya sp. 'hensonii']|uniref:hypothetical protein n=1 Tax=Leptolyngbya sp. 'hensonii' TaxID=1922337 RepID=UPI00094FCAD8|nr:hypothetical protein [Leptolyngbya sp. 'hensonii']OLP20080.1 hypothetical protein BST81_02250 [Leptolyngbya sp. 'hensonii']